MNDGDLLLMTRMDVMKRSLSQVQQVVQAIQARRRETRELKELLEQCRTRLLDVRYNVGAADLLLENAEGLLSSPLDPLTKGRQQVQTSREATKKLLESLESAKTIVANMEKRTVQIVENQDIAKTLGSALADRARDHTKNLELIQKKVDNARSARSTGELGKTDGLMSEAWSAFGTLQRDETRPLFEEYVDFLRGLALRDNGFGTGICRTADELIRKWAPALQVPWESLTIPSLQEPPSMTFARVIRVGFPEWTIWALPLVAHEFGHVVAAEDSRVVKLINDHANGNKSRAHRADFAVDAIATYAMGPAYACAAILLRLNPMAPYTDNDLQPAHAHRAQVIFKMLELMSSKAETAPYASTIAVLEEQWTAALRQVEPGAPAAESDLTELHAYVTQLYNYLNDNRGPIYSTLDWDEIQAWPQALCAADTNDGIGAPENTNIVIDGSEGFLAVLNAAWKCRIDHPKADVEAIAAAAWDLWHAIEARQSAAESNSSYAWRANRGVAPLPSMEVRA